MKARYVILAIMFLSLQVRAQIRRDIVNGSVPVTWLGIDFSKARLIGEPYFQTEENVKKYMQAYNELMAAEREKYDMAGALRRDSITEAFYITVKRNQSLDASSLIQTEMKPYPLLTPSDVQDIISSYDFEGLHGLGVMINIDSFDKFNLRGHIWVTFINLTTKEVLLTERFSTTPKGFGPRNYWSNCISIPIKYIRKTRFKNWKSLYAKD